MVSLRSKLGVALLALAWICAMAAVAASPATAQTYNCLPSCSSSDARFLAIANGSGFITLSQPTLDLEISVPAGTTTFTVGVFDGDARGTDGAGLAHWDSGSPATFSYTLFADPLGNRTGSTVVPLDGSASVPSTSMPDNAWRDFTVTTSPVAQAPSGHYFYYLRVRLTSLTIAMTNAFKVRSGGGQVGGSTLFPSPEPFSYIANIASTADAQIVYPNYPTLTPTNYNGTFSFFFEMPTTPEDMALWDGDFDRGKFNGTDLDADDPDTPNSPFLPSWRTIDTLPEGIAVGALTPVGTLPAVTTGNPPDDRNPGTTVAAMALLKPPSIRYELIFPDGQVFVNENPSGNQEWEQFRISRDPYDPSQMDYSTPDIPHGVYEVRIHGVDMQNLNALLFPGRAVCVDELGTPCTPLRRFLIGDTVFADTDGDGEQDPDEPGIPNVIVELLDSAGIIIATTTTDADGHYSFEVDAGFYTVRISPDNFNEEIGGVLVGYNNTTPEQCTAPIDDGNVDNCDFGYQGRGSIGNRVWYDANSNGVQDAGEPGMNGVQVELVDGNGDVLDIQTTSVDGNYEFTDVEAGTYTVRVDMFTLSDNATPTYDLDGVATPHEAVVTLASAQHRTDVDFGYVGDAAIGDRVWNDADNDGVQDAGEAGINGVTLYLYDIYLGEVVATAVTSGDGNYSFQGLFSSTYQVQVETTTLPAGYVQTYDLDGLGTPDNAEVTVGAGETRSDVDFGYRDPNAVGGSIGDRVWNDANGDGVQDAGEAGLNGVTVELLDSANNVVATTTTAGDGNYTFSDLAAGNYTVRVVAATLPAGVAPTFDADGTGTPHTAAVTLASGANVTTVDFGYRGTASVGDRVWYDANGDGVQDAGETGINGVTVELLDGGGNVIATTTTAGDGNYTFSFLMGGSYSVRVVSASLPPGVAQTYDLDGVGTPHVASFTLAGGENRTDVDFGYRGTGSVGDRLWLDTNGDGVQDAGEAGINGATVQLFDASNNLIATTTTSGDGIYGFSDLGAGTYTVRIVPSTLPAGVEATYDLDGVATLNEATFTLGAAASRDDVDFGYRGTASVGDRVWNDANGDGVQDAGEAGINGVTVELLDSTSNVIATTTTSGDGNYTFDYLLGGSYSVRVVAATLPAGLAPTYDLDGIGTAHVASFTLNAGQDRTDVDFGYRGTASIGDRVWNDANGNGTQDVGEAGINGVTVELLDSANNVIATTTTAGDGNYTFSNLNGGTYTVRVTPPAGYAPTYDVDGVGTPNAATVTLAAGDNRTDVDFGYRGTASVGDRVWDDANGNGTQDAGEAGINGVTVELLDSANNVVATTTTAGDGNYTFSNLNAGTYTVRVTPPAGYAPTYDVDGVGTPNAATVTLAAGDNRTDVDFGYRGTASIGDRVWNDADGDGTQDAGEAGINGVTIELLDSANNVIATTTTSGDGNYTFSNLNAGTYTVRVTAPAGTAPTYDVDGVGTPNVATVTLTAGQNRTDVDFGYRGTASIGDRVWNDRNGDGTQDAGEAGINGVTVELLDGANNVVATTTTSGDGNYTFSNLNAGTYTVRVTAPAGTAPTYDVDGVGTPNVATVTLAAGQNRTDVDFGYRGTASIGDRVWNDANGNGIQDAGEAGINGVTVELLDGATVIATTTTSGDGNYTFSNLDAGTYTVRVTAPAGYAPTYDVDGVGTPNVATVTLTAGQNRTDVDFGYRGTASIGDRVWNDANGNGIQDAGEAGINGVTVELLDGANTVIATTTTSGDGNYTFSNLDAGTYTVRVTAPAGTAPTYDVDGIGTPNVATVTLAAGQNRTDVDFGYRGTASIGDRVWNDANGNGIQDAGEAGINGVTVELLDGANTVIATTTTSGDGNYTFSNLDAGTYTVRVTAPAGTAPTYDADGIGTPNVATVTLAAGQNRTDVDFGYRGTASVGDRLWIDGNGNGVQDAGEAGINGVTVELLDAASNVIATTVTAGDGNYGFGNLNAGNYSVRVVAATLPAGLAPTYDLDGVATPNVASFTLAAGASRTDVDFGYRGNGSVGDRIWNDADGDGAQDAGETGINGVTVELLDAANNVIATTVTAGDGNYGFGNLLGGNYTVRVVSSTLPAGFAPTYDLDGIATAHTASFSLAAGASRDDVDFGYRATASIGDRVWSDLDGDGVQEAGEAGINGVTVELLDSTNTVIATTTTSGDGDYTFGGLATGAYTVRVVSATVPDGFEPTYDLDGTATAHTAVVALGTTSRTDVDFGYRPDGDCVVKADLQPELGAGIGGHDFWMPGIGEDFVFTPAPGGFVVNPDGTASLTGTLRSAANPANAFTVDVQFSGFTTTPPAGSPKKEFAPSAYVENGGPIDPAGWWYYTAFTGTLTGTGNYAGAVIDIVKTGPAFQVGVGANNKNGNYGFSGWFNWTVTQQPASGNLTATGQGDINSDLVECPPATASVGDRVWNDVDGDGVQDAGEAGINGVTVELLDTFGNVIATTTTSGDGNYGFANLLAGNYSVRVTAPAGYAPTYDLDGTGTANVATFTLATGQARTDVDFGYRGNASIGDRVWNDKDGDGVQDAGEAGINGVTVELLDAANNVIATTTTSGDGNYTFSNLNAGTYTVRVTAPAGTAPTYDADGVGTPNVATVTLNAGDSRTDIDFGYRGTASIGDRVWNDADGDGVQDAGETGINGVTVELLDAANNVIATTTTAGNGNYTFGNLDAGTYTVRVTAPTGTAPTYDVDGVGTPNVAAVTVTAGQTRTDVDFGYRGTASVGDRVWNDADGDGVQDAGEAGINGVTVQLLDSANNVIATTTTAGDGNYTFSNLGAGSYSVRVTAPAGFAQTYDLDGVGTANVASFTLTAGQTRTDVDFGYRGTASVGDRVWNDADGDGVQDAGETGINGVTVELLDAANNVIATTTTSGNGNYTFSNLNAGSYSVRVTAPAGFAQTYDLDGVGTANVAAFTLTAGQTRTDVDFGYRGTASVGDRVWNDVDGDGVQDAGETGINGVTVQLLDSANNVIATTTTSGNGNYTFSNLSAGSYSVRVTPPAGFAQTYDLDGVGTANVAAFTLTAGQTRTDVDFGYRGNLSVGDRVWNDADGDGTQDAAETGLNGVTVQLLDSSNTVIATATTAGNGNYTFNNLAPGNYSVRVVSGSLPAGYTQTYDLDGVATAHTASFSLTASRTDVDFGYKPPVVCTPGNFKDTFTNASFSNNEGTRSWSGAWIENDVAGAGVNSGNVTVGNPVSGYMILNDSPDTGTQPSAARQMDLSGFASATLSVDLHIRGVESDDAAVIEVSNNGGSSYTVLETFSGLTGNHVFSRTYNISAYMASNTRIRFRISANYGGDDDYFKIDMVKVDASCTPPATYSVGDRVWKDTDGDGIQDAGETGIANVTVQLLDSSNNVIATDVTDSNGIYGFTNIPTGTYTVRVVSSTLPSGYTPTYDLDGVATPHTVSGPLTENRSDVDFGYKPGTTPCTAGNFKDTFTNASFSNNEGSLSWAAAWVESDSAGAGVNSGNVTVGNPVSGYMILNDSPDTGTQPSAARQMNLSGYASATLAVDLHIRGVESDDAAVIEVSNNGGSSYTVLETFAGLTGNHVFSRTYNISAYMASNTRIRFRISANYGGSDDYFKIDMVKVDASCTPPVSTFSIGDRVWKDLDRDGVQDSGEPGLSGVTVQLLNSGGTVVATTTTDSNGNYSFTNRAAGTYTVKVVSSTVPSGLTPSYDLDGVASAHQATFNLTANRTDVDFGYKPPFSNPGTGTIGFWKNHPEDWPVESITLGNQTYTKSQAVALLGKSSAGDKSIDLAKQLIAAKLNVLIDNDSTCIASTITAADNWLRQYPVGSGVSGSSTAWQTGSPLHTTLDDYNNGELCAPHRG